MTYSEHSNLLGLLFHHLGQYFLVNNLEKSIFAASRVEFLRYEVLTTIVPPLHSHLELQHPQSNIFKQL
jgi:hypothetical protein